MMSTELVNSSITKSTELVNAKMKQTKTKEEARRRKTGYKSVLFLTKWREKVRKKQEKSKKCLFVINKCVILVAELIKGGDVASTSTYGMKGEMKSFRNACWATNTREL